MKRTLSVLVFSISTAFYASAQTITFGIVPQQSAVTLAKNWGPILQYLSQQVGHDVVFRTAKDIPEFEKRVLAGEYDIAYMNPYHYTVFHQKPGYTAFAKQKNKQIRGILVINKNAPITAIEQLNGKSLAFPSPVAFAATVVPMSALAQKGIHVEPKYVSSHESVYLNVAQGFFPAGGGIERTFNNSAPEIRDQLRILWRTPGYTPHAFAFHPGFNPELAEQIQSALLAMNDSKEGLELLKNISFNGISPAQDSDWDDVRALHITLLEHMVEE
ncbi:phosphonate transport system substrate-binding protein [Vibrio xiamenensis]|uniref:Phosphonate transport system substrate-binding protein n=1 Tax=Vibrio xiamenensis TaxID=861298 RepID=A0A1G8ANS5_9VIBR|nr:phosphate/phosphite/phosphonate ABC transporter substrate-binding protein [Vibrio xiamenensis]SDH22722.1 phosphonate transport system substrate-binding protein [Vibrio xiamenensis]